MAKAKKGKLTIEDALVPVEEQEYSIPENWVWIYQNVACQLADGEKKSGEEYPYLEVKYLRGNIEAEIKERNIPKLYKDRVFKSIFKDNPNILAKMLADIIGINYEDKHLSLTFPALTALENLSYLYKMKQNDILKQHITLCVITKTQENNI